VALRVAFPAGRWRHCRRAGVSGSAAPAAAPPPPPAAPVRVGGQIQPPKKIKHVDPVYPTIAQAARKEGVVILELTIGTDGKCRT
jgi:outer membrane biosynthesis protein TonB